MTMSLKGVASSAWLRRSDKLTSFETEVNSSSDALQHAHPFCDGGCEQNERKSY